MLEEAWRVCGNREQIGKKRLGKTIATATVAALGQAENKDQGAYWERGGGIPRRDVEEKACYCSRISVRIVKK